MNLLENEIFNLNDKKESLDILEDFDVITVTWR